MEACPLAAQDCGITDDVVTMMDREAMKESMQCLLAIDRYETDACQAVLEPIQQRHAEREAMKAARRAEKQAKIANLIATCPTQTSQCGITAADVDNLEDADKGAMREKFQCIKNIDVDALEAAGNTSEACLNLLEELQSRGGRGAEDDTQTQQQPMQRFQQRFGGRFRG